MDRERLSDLCGHGFNVGIENRDETTDRVKKMFPVWAGVVCTFFSARDAVAGTINLGSDPAGAFEGIIRWAVPIAVSALVALLVLWVNTRQTAEMHRQRLAGDRELANEKAAADLALAERKVALDRSLAAWKRQAEIAEQTLTLFYEAEASLRWARSPAMFGGEGATRKQQEGEDEKLKERRDSYFVPLERLNRDREVFAKLQSIKYLFFAYFGQEASNPFTALIELHNQIQSSASILLQMAASEDFAPADSFVPLRANLGWGKRPDEADEKMGKAMEQMERTCRDALRGMPA